MFKIGITGGIGSGKTTVTRLFAGLGIEIVDADVAARDVVQPGTPALAQIAGHFGAGILLPDGNLNRRRLRKRVFDNPDEKCWLEALLHPEIKALCRQRLESANSPYALLSSPLLIESGEHRLVNRVLVVDVPEDLQITRTCARDTAPAEQIQQIIDSQISRTERLRYADDVIDNSGDEPALRTAVENLHEKYLMAASTT